MIDVVSLCLILGIIVTAFLAIWLRELLFATISLSMASALLAVLFYLSGASMAAVFELSVGAGLVTVLFISAISLAKSGREEDPSAK